MKRNIRDRDTESQRKSFHEFVGSNVEEYLGSHS